MGRHMRVVALALAASLLLHAAILAALGGRLPRWEAPVAATPMEVQLAERVRPVTPSPALAARPRPAAPIEVPPVAAVEPALVEPAAPAPMDDDAEALASTEAVGVAPPEAEPEPEPPAIADAPPPLNSLPARVDMRFSVHYGFAVGEQTLVWVSDGTHYTLTSVAAATGLAGVFYRGRLVQTSRGRITPQGLVPEEFWDQRGERRSSARFDHGTGRITLTPAQGAPRHLESASNAQDLLSVLFQLALTAPPEGPQRYTVFNGKKLRDYTFESHGEVDLDTALGMLRTLHVARVAAAGGRFEAWLARDHHHLPVRVLRGDDDGNVAELRVLSIAP